MRDSTTWISGVSLFLIGPLVGFFVARAFELGYGWEGDVLAIPFFLAWAAGTAPGFALDSKLAQRREMRLEARRRKWQEEREQPEPHDPS